VAYGYNPNYSREKDGEDPHSKKGKKLVRPLPSQQKNMGMVHVPVTSAAAGSIK
jgi:hypothetical protein